MPTLLGQKRKNTAHQYSLTVILEFMYLICHIAGFIALYIADK